MLSTYKNTKTQQRIQENCSYKFSFDVYVMCVRDLIPYIKLTHRFYTFCGKRTEL